MMQTVRLEDIDHFVSLKSLAVFGVSRTGRKFGNTIFRELLSRGYNVYPVHPTAETIQGATCYPDLAALPTRVDGIVVVTNRDQTLDIVRQAIDAGVTKIWIQQGADSPQALIYGNEKGATVISKECLLMYLEPLGFPHNAHRCVRRWMGRMPKKTIYMQS